MEDQTHILLCHLQGGRFHLCNPTCITPTCQLQHDRGAKKGILCLFPLSQNLSTFFTIDILGQIVFHCGRMFCALEEVWSIPGLYWVPVIFHFPQVVTTKHDSRLVKYFLEWRIFYTAHILQLELSHMVTHRYKEECSILFSLCLKNGTIKCSL